MNGLFDFNRDGRLDGFERTAEFLFYKGTGQSTMTEFERSGLNAEELEYMSASRRRSVLRKAGLNPDEYDF